MGNRFPRRVLLRAGLATTLTVLAPATATAGTVPAPIQLKLPEPTGPYQIGTSSRHLLDQERADPLHEDRPRELMVTITYPARRAQSYPLAEWLSSGMATAVEKVAATDPLDVPKAAVSWAATNRWAHVDAPVDRLHGRWPVVLFSPGLGMPRELYTASTDDLASRGFVVISMSHTYDSFAVEFPGGRVETTPQHNGDPATLKTLIDARVADTRFVLDQLTMLDLGVNPDAEGRPLPPGLRGALDLSKVGMFGHSYGGYTAGEAMYYDRRIDAGANMDGTMAYGFGGTSGFPYLPGEVAKHGLDRPFLLMGARSVTDPATGRLVEHSHLSDGGDQSWVDFWRNQRSWKRDLTLWQGLHMNYSDLQAVIPQMKSLIPASKQAQLIGTVDPARSLIAQHDYLAAFFDLHLYRRNNHLLDGQSPDYPEIRFAG